MAHSIAAAESRQHPAYSIESNDCDCDDSHCESCHPPVTPTTSHLRRVVDILRDLERVDEEGERTWSELRDDYHGQTIGAALQSVDRGGVTVYWGCIPESVLAYVVTRRQV